MKVQILQLDAHDDLASARDKLAWAQAERVVLVWPDRARILRKRLELLLLRRQAARQGVELGLVTRDPVVLEHACELGIPVFRSSTRLTEEVWQSATTASLLPPVRPGRRETPVRPPRDQPRALPAWMRGSVVALLGVSLAVAAAILLPTATITIYPELRTQEQHLVLTLDPKADAPGPDGRVPARLVSLTQEGSMRVTTTGKTEVPGLPASGEVVLTNLTDESVLVPSGTGVLPTGRPDLRFTTVADLSLPAGEDSTGSVHVVAARPGLSGNLPAHSLDAIDGPLGLRATVAQPERLTGGTETERAAVAAADQATAFRLLTEQLLTDAASEVEAGLQAGEALAPASLRVVRTPQRVYDREIGAAADSVGLDLTLEVTALVYEMEDVEAAVALGLAGKRLSSSDAVPGSLRWTLSGSVAARPEELPVRTEQQVFTPIPVSAVSRLVRGMRPSAANDRLAALPGQAQPAQVETAPAWWPFVPWLEVRVRVRMPWEQA